MLGCSALEHLELLAQVRWSAMKWSSKLVCIATDYLQNKRKIVPEKWDGDWFTGYVLRSYPVNFSLEKEEKIMGLWWLRGGSSL